MYQVSLLAVEAIVAKYLTPKQSTTTKTTKHLIKRPYRVSDTDLDVLAENIMKKQMKQGTNMMKKKSTGGDDDKMSKLTSKKTKTSSKTTRK